MKIVACVWCACGARYERAEVRLPIKDVGVFECFHCGQVMERWQGRTVPTFKLIARPDENATSAA